MSSSSTTAEAFSTEDLLLLVSSTKPELSRLVQNATKKYVASTRVNDAVHLFNNFEEAKECFLKSLAEHSVRHYMTALSEAARIPEVADRVFGAAKEEGLAQVDAVIAGCDSLSTKVPRKNAGAGQRASPNGGRALAVDDDEDGGSSSAMCEGAIGIEGILLHAQLREENAVLTAQLAGLKDRLDDAKAVIEGLMRMRLVA